MAGQHCDRHRVIARILTRRGTDIGMGIDPQDRQIIAVTGGQLRKGGHAHRALPAQRENPGRVVPLDDVKGTAELVDDSALRLDAVHLLQVTAPRGPRLTGPIPQGEPGSRGRRAEGWLRPRRLYWPAGCRRFCVVCARTGGFAGTASVGVGSAVSDCRYLTKPRAASSFS
jgi:hypothetical protein